MSLDGALPLATRTSFQYAGNDYTLFDIYGPVSIGNCLSFWFYGILCVMVGLCSLGRLGPGADEQIVMYWDHIRADKWYNQAVVAALFLLTTVDTILNAIRTLLITALYPGDIIYFLLVGNRWEDWAGIFVSDLGIILAQGFLAFRAIRFARAMRDSYGKKMAIAVWVTAVVLFLGILLSMGSGFAAPLYLRTIKTYLQVERQSNATFAMLSTLQISSFLGVDIIITVIMTTEMVMAKTGFAASNRVLDVIIKLVLRNCFIVTVLQTVQLIAFWKTETTWSEFPPMFLAKVYAITVVSILCEPRVAHRAHQHRLDEEALRDPSEEKSGGHSSSYQPGLGSHSGQIAPGTPLGVSSVGSRCRSCGAVSTALSVSRPPSVKLGPGTPRDLGIPILRKGGLPDREEGAIGFKAALLGVLEDDDSIETPGLNIVVDPLGTRMTDIGCDDAASAEIEAQPEVADMSRVAEHTAQTAHQAEEASDENLPEQMSRLEGGDDAVSISEILGMTQYTYVL